MTARTTSATAGRPSRVLILLAAAWMAVAMAIGGSTVEAESANQAPPSRVAANRTAGP
jgi:hypothetical protein